MGTVFGTGLTAKGLRSEFISAFVDTPSVQGLLSTTVPSNAASEDYAWLGETPAMREFIDERKVKGFTDTTYQIVNKTWEATMSVKRSELEDDQVGAINVRVQDLARRSRQHIDELLYQALTDNGTGYDGAAFFSNTHPARGEGSAQDNLLTGTGTTTAALKTDIQAAIAALKDFTDERGKPFTPMLNSADLVILCPPAIEWTMREALEATIISNTSNVLAGVVGQVIATPWLTPTDANDWYLLYTGHTLKPLIFQDRMGVEFNALEQDSEAGFMRELYLYGVRARYNVGYGFWQHAVKTTNA